MMRKLNPVLQVLYMQTIFITTMGLWLLIDKFLLQHYLKMRRQLIFKSIKNTLSILNVSCYSQNRGIVVTDNLSFAGGLAQRYSDQRSTENRQCLIMIGQFGWLFLTL